MKLPWAKEKRRAIGREDFFGRTIAGTSAPVTHERAAGLSAVYAAVRVVAETVGSLPCHVTESRGDGTRGIVDHPVTALLESPNAFMTRPEFFETVVSQQELRGNSYFEVVRDKALKPVALYPMPPGTCYPERRGPGVVFSIQTKTGKLEVNADRICHLKFCVLSPDGVTGVDPVKLLEKDLSVACNARDTASQYFDAGMMPSGVLTHPMSLDTDVKAELAQQFKQAYSGTKNSFAVLLLDEGFKFDSMSFDPEKSQLLESRQFSINDIARIWRIPAHFLSDLSRSTFTNAGTEAESLVKHSLRSRLVRLEAALTRSLLSPTERLAGLRISFSIDALLRGSTLERYQAHEIAIRSGFLTIDEVRQLEDREPMKAAANG